LSSVFGGDGPCRGVLLDPLFREILEQQTTISEAELAALQSDIDLIRDLLRCPLVGTDLLRLSLALVVDDDVPRTISESRLCRHESFPSASVREDGLESLNDEIP